MSASFRSLIDRLNQMSDVTASIQLNEDDNKYCSKKINSTDPEYLEKLNAERRGEIYDPSKQDTLDYLVNMTQKNKKSKVVEEEPIIETEEDDKNSSMSGIINSMNDANGDSEEDVGTDSTEFELDDLVNDTEELESLPNDILSNPLIKQLMIGGATSLNLSQRKQALDILKDYLSDVENVKKTPSIGEAEEEPEVMTEDEGAPEGDNNDLLERLAEIEHNQWEEWSKNIAETETISPERLARWETMWVPYSDLTDEQKDQDREYAKKVLQVIGKN